MLKSLEILRFFAAVLVVFAHFPYTVDIMPLIWITDKSSLSGAIGVDLFFCISGFVIYLSVHSKKCDITSFKRFLIDRIRRIMPLYLLITVMVFLLTLKKTELSELLTSLFLIPTFDDGMYLDPIVTLGWTLRFELFFYSIVSIGILLHSKLLIPMTLAILSIVANYNFGFYFGETIIIEFMLGYILAYLYRNEIVTFKFNTVFTVISTLVFLYVMQGSDIGYNLNGVPRMNIMFNDYLYDRWLIWGVPSILVLLSFVSMENKFDIKGYWLGKYTYSIYLWSYIFIAIVTKVTIFSRISPEISLFIMSIGLSIVSYISFHKFELIFLKKRMSFEE